MYVMYSMVNLNVRDIFDTIKFRAFSKYDTVHFWNVVLFFN